MIFLVFLEHTRMWLTLLILTALSYIRDFHSIYSIAGGAAMTLIAKILKYIIRQPRPISPISPNNHANIKSKKTTKNEKKSYGMPSAHSSITIYFATYISLQLFSSSLPYFTRLLLSIIISITALSVVWSRVRLGHHTKSQVIAGVILGFSFGLIWDIWWWKEWNSRLIKLRLDGKLGWNEITILINFINNGLVIN
ncbi:hypothetical protein Glove_99g359 [Diversispora epigaea]|uniref:Phosphatidic acid phosphatase type 2/haloperoxidase domain-containing protein n=1 Tax=Diversispora epigaea TaxID=1348612 RepID=A0A397J7U3_9GLOM|nr:hypothetical protein Glove_99g359 [Diversispora epigaea]